jgi:hypothetical protein
MLHPLSIACVLGLAIVTATAAEPGKDFPKGSEKAVAGVQKEFPKAEIDEVAEPKGFGGSGGKGTPLYWSVKIHVGEHKQELSVTPEGTIIRVPTTVPTKDLPKAVADAVAKAAPGATVKNAVKNESRATIKYVALDKARVQQYQVEVVKDKKRSVVTLAADGSGAKVKEVPDEPAAKDKEKDKGDKEVKEIDIPAKAAKAVKAIKDLYPDGKVIAITHEVFDDGSGTIDILTYEVEFISKGQKREMVASPEGVIPHLWAPVETKELPKAVKDAVDKAVPGAEAVKARAFEIRAGLRFAALEQPRTYYVVTVVEDGKDRAIGVQPDGTLIKRAGFGKK